MEAELIISQINPEDNLYYILFQTGFSAPPAHQTDTHKTSQLSRLWSEVPMARLQRLSSSPNKIIATLSRSLVSSRHQLRKPPRLLMWSRWPAALASIKLLIVNSSRPTSQCEPTVIRILIKLYFAPANRARCQKLDYCLSSMIPEIQAKASHLTSISSTLQQLLNLHCFWLPLRSQSPAATTSSAP